MGALQKLGAKENILLSQVSTFHIGGPAALFIETNNADTIQEACSICRESGFPIALIGNGSNILCPDAGFEGLVIKAKRSESLPQITEDRITAFAGDSLTYIANYTVKSGYSGFERLAGIPGTIGGAIAMNAGAYGGEIIDVLDRVHVLQSGIDRWITASREEFGYRISPFTWPKTIVLEAEFKLSPGDGSERVVMEDCLMRRKDKQPLEFPSAGSVFKRPTGHFAGKLIEEAGLKGFRIGGAEVSEKHAGFIINRGGATEKDVLDLIDYIQNSVYSKYGVKLEREVLMLGEIACTF